MRRWLQVSSYHWLVLFGAMGLFAAAVAWLSVNLATVAMANIRFLTAYGWQAVLDGGLRQFFEIITEGALSLACYLAFKACEVELVHRWRNWRRDT